MSNGTEIGTVLVKDIYSGPDGSSPRSLHALGDTLYFRAAEPLTGHEPWRSDGTEGGTILLKDINPGPAARRRQTPRLHPTRSSTRAARSSSRPTTE